MFKTGDQVRCQLNGLIGEVLGPGMARDSQLVHFPTAADCVVIRDRFLEAVEAA